jgi:hypothetical protein
VSPVSSDFGTGGTLALQIHLSPHKADLNNSRQRAYNQIMHITKSILVSTAIAAAVIGCNSTPPPADKPAPVAVTSETPPPKPAAAPTPMAVATPAPAPAAAPAMTPMTSLVPAKPALVTLKFNPASMDAIEAGTKTSTTRKGVRVFPSKFVTAVDGGDADRTIKLEIVTATPKKLSDLTESDSKSDGSDSLDSFKSALTTNYPGIGADDMVTVITFKVVK